MAISRTTYALAGGLLLGALAAAPAMANTVTWNFGTIGANGGTVCAANCALGTGVFGFTAGGNTLDLSAYSSVQYSQTIYQDGHHHTVTYFRNYGPSDTKLTQKPGSGNETGIGAQAPKSALGTAEINTNEAVLINASLLPTGSELTSLMIGSIQANEGFNVYGLSSLSSLSGFDGGIAAKAILPPNNANLPTGWNKVASYTNNNNNVSQQEQVNLLFNNGVLPSYSYYLVTSSAADVVLESAAATLGSGNVGVPEPASMALMLVGVLGLGALRFAGRSRA
ncbi:MAG: PEP-CTERM sorting domain-containing protein [Rhodospirillales bacterium]|nr:PEP-CTERM sorting domain-containing protein [Rhodospirillales bacterium]